jgi:hypothetical protein
MIRQVVDPIAQEFFLRRQWSCVCSSICAWILWQSSRLPWVENVFLHPVQLITAMKNIKITHQTSRELQSEQRVQQCDASMQRSCDLIRCSINKLNDSLTVLATMPSTRSQPESSSSHTHMIMKLLKLGRIPKSRYVTSAVIYETMTYKTLSARILWEYTYMLPSGLHMEYIHIMDLLCGSLRGAWPIWAWVSTSPLALCMYLYTDW